MIKEVVIKNFALIEDLKLNFNDGLNVLMGETGSGKSNIIEALSLVMGERVNKEKIRGGEDKAFVSVAFDISLNDNAINFLNENNFQIDDEPLIITREINRNSNTINRINGIIVSANLLKDLSKFLLDIYGQFDNITILSKSQQRGFIDSLGNSNFKKLLIQYENLFDEYTKISSEYNKLTESPEKIARDIEFLEFQINDIENSHVLELDEENLFEKLKIMENAQSLQDNLKNADYLFSDDLNGIVENLSKALSLSEDISEIDSEFKSINTRIDQVYIECEDISREISYYADKIFFDEDEYRELDNTRNELFNAKKKYGETIADINDYYLRAKKELGYLKNFEENIATKKERISKLERELSDLATKISVNRNTIGKNLKEEILKQLKELEMKDSNFEILQKQIPLGRFGKDEVEFLVSFNKNEELKEFSEVASGGEISRFMLAIKSIEANLEKKPTLIFDEIDTGISGNAGNVVGKKLKNLSKNHQLIVISHLPQIISKADTQFLVYKEEEEDSIKSKIKELNYEERIVELAKVIEGNNYGEHTLNTAKSMIDGNMRGV